jgi:hypothetical protein
MISDLHWDALSAMVDEGWPGKFDDNAAAAWRVLLDQLDADAEDVARGIAACIARGGRWRPAVSEVVTEIRRLREPAKPTFGDVVNAIYGPDGVLHPMTSRVQERRARIAACDRCDNGWLCDEESNTARPCECRGVAEPVTDEMRLARADELHPLIGVFVRRQGLSRLSHLDLDEPTYGEANYKRLEDAWKELLDEAETRDVAELVTGGRRGELVRFDPAKLLERRAAS